MRKLFLYILFFVPASVLFGQDEYIIKGTVIDQVTGEPLVGVTITHVPSGEEFTTDFDGNFKIKTAETGMKHLKISYISYEDAELKRVIVKQGEPIDLKIKLRKHGVQTIPKKFMANEIHVGVNRS